MDWAEGIVPRPDQVELETFIRARDILASETQENWYWSTEGKIYSDSGAEGSQIVAFPSEGAHLASSVAALYNYAPKAIDALKQMAEVVNDGRKVIREQQESMDEIGEETAKMSVSLGVLAQERVILKGFVEDMLLSSDPEVSAKARDVIQAIHGL